jgi:hypothetical protein
MAEASTLRFIHHFSRSLKCEMLVRDIAPGPGESFQFTCQWTGQPRPKHLPEYRRWILYTAQLLVDRWQKRIGYALSVSPSCTEFWTFEPGAAPKLLKKFNCGIP